MPETNTTPPSVHTPITDANPTAAEMLKGVCVTSSDSTPPIAANGKNRQHQQRVPERIERREQKSQNDQQADRENDGEPPLFFAASCHIRRPIPGDSPPAGALSGPGAILHVLNRAGKIAAAHAEFHGNVACGHFRDRS